VHPTLIPTKRLIANVEGAMNAVLVKGDAVGATLYYGKGAGAEPTASAVIADLVDVTRMHTADPEHRVPHLAFQPDAMVDLPVLPMADVITSYYLRMRVEDRPGVLADVTRILADQQISIDAMIQREPGEGEEQTDIIMLTHQTRERTSTRRSPASRRCRPSRGRSSACVWKSCCRLRAGAAFGGTRLPDLAKVLLVDLPVDRLLRRSGRHDRRPLRGQLAQADAANRRLERLPHACEHLVDRR
jgi:hypothetical protein